MEERQDNTKNIKILRQRIKEEKIKGLLTSAKQTQTRVSSISKLLGEKESELRRKAAEEVVVAEPAAVSEEVAAPVVEAKPVKEEVKKVSKKVFICQSLYLI